MYIRIYSPNEDSDEPGYWWSLITAFKGSKVWSRLLSTNHAEAQQDQYFLWAHMSESTFSCSYSIDGTCPCWLESRRNWLIGPDSIIKARMSAIYISALILSKLPLNRTEQNFQFSTSLCSGRTCCRSIFSNIRLDIFFLIEEAKHLQVHYAINHQILTDLSGEQPLRIFRPVPVTIYSVQKLGLLFFSQAGFDQNISGLSP